MIVTLVAKVGVLFLLNDVASFRMFHMRCTIFFTSSTSTQALFFQLRNMHLQMCQHSFLGIRLGTYYFISRHLVSESLWWEEKERVAIIEPAASPYTEPPTSYGPSQESEEKPFFKICKVMGFINQQVNTWSEFRMRTYELNADTFSSSSISVVLRIYNLRKYGRREEKRRKKH
jgi:hypothetical protein